MSLTSYQTAPPRVLKWLLWRSASYYATALIQNARLLSTRGRVCRSCVATQAKKSGRILVGTASWTDPGFVEHWYPKGMPAADRLAWYAEQFEMVEVNSTFYAVPDPRMVERWCRSTPDGFIFDVKLHQLLSRHSTKVKLLPPKLQKRRGDGCERQGEAHARDGSGG